MSVSLVVLSLTSVVRHCYVICCVMLCNVFYYLLLQKSVGLPDVHSGYGFAIGNMAAFDMGDPKAVVSPG